MPPSTYYAVLLALVLGVGCGKKGERLLPPEPPKTVPVNIADPIFEKAIREELEKPTGELTKADYEKVTELSLADNQLTEVPQGLEKLTKLTFLVLTKNQLTAVRGLEKLTQLEELCLAENQLTDVKGLENLTQLEYLRLYDNQLTKLRGLEELAKLETLKLGSNKLTDVTGLEKLTKLK